MGEFFLFHPVYEGMTYGPPPDLCTEQKKEGEYTHPPYVVRGKEEKFPHVRGLSPRKRAHLIFSAIFQPIFKYLDSF